MDDRIPHGQSMHPAEARDADVRHASSHAHAGPRNARALAAHARMVTSLRASLEADGLAVTIRETHISTVVVAGSDAYKIKKPVALPFLDFSTPAARLRYCRAEVRLNRRFAPELYLGVVPITGTHAHARIDGVGRAIDHAVHMRAFPQDALAAARVARGLLTTEDVDRLASTVAGFHAGARRTRPNSRHGTPAGVLARALANCTELSGCPLPEHGTELLASLHAWILEEHARLRPTLARRRAEGFVREGHGDLHLGNVVFLEGAPRLFDCIEFSADLRWIDVMSDVAFMMMDLAARGHADLGWRFVNEYLEQTGDYGGLAVLPFQLVYRAMVRAKVACLRLRKGAGADERATAESELLRYLRLAACVAAPRSPALVITCGAAASGKSTFAAAFATAAGAVRIRTDVERKRLLHLPRDATSGSALDAGLYAPAMTRATYARVADLARTALRAGMVTIVDGTFLARWQRTLLRKVASEVAEQAANAKVGDGGARHGIPFAIARMEAPASVLRDRLVARAAAGEAVSEASLPVLERQLAGAEPLDADEAAVTVPIDTMTPTADARTACAPLLARLGIATSA